MVIQDDAKLVKEAYTLRIEGKAFSTIARLLKEKHGKKTKFNYEANKIHRIINMKFYY